MQETNPLIPVSIQLGIIPDRDSDVRKSIVEKINHLILHDFEKLVYLLYRIDVSEKKIDQLLRRFPQTDAAEMIADLMIEREAEKMRSRQEFKQRGEDSGEERW
ncbi:hypothetical protein [Ferruginibacter sp. HRS2-29]|uniref:hypothetical protein n=1 Tax=Ferruginibacter sp. HRS2-29 TaxID=2487334 RepID=UPI0020CE63D6|nr:hypothetical protein [Ferruginibacter sp. HRS2-29]MCP9751285.1 hypothetical protein [Ferruginibacter sp. HRS2-29]